MLNIRRDKTMINLKELSSKLGVHHNTIRSYIKKGLPHIKLERKYLFDYDKVIEWLEKRG